MQLLRASRYGKQIEMRNCKVRRILTLSKYISEKITNLAMFCFDCKECVRKRIHHKIVTFDVKKHIIKDEVFYNECLWYIWTNLSQSPLYSNLTNRILDVKVFMFFAMFSPDCCGPLALMKFKFTQIDSCVNIRFMELKKKFERIT